MVKGHGILRLHVNRFNDLMPRRTVGVGLAVDVGLNTCRRAEDACRALL